MKLNSLKNRLKKVVIEELVSDDCDGVVYVRPLTNHQFRYYATLPQASKEEQEASSFKLFSEHLLNADGTPFIANEADLDEIDRDVLRLFEETIFEHSNINVGAIKKKLSQTLKSDSGE